MRSSRRSLPVALVLLLAACGPTAPEPGTGGGGYKPGTGGAGTGGTGGGGGEEPTVRESLAFAAFNVLRFFDTVCDSGACSSGDWEELPSEAAFAARADELAHAIDRLAVDVLCLEEVENGRALAALGERLPEFSTRLVGETGSPGSMDVALLARFPVTKVRGHRDRVLHRPDGSETRFAREFLEVHLDVDGTTAIVFCAHFKAKADDDPGRRLAEAQAAAAILAETSAGYPDALVVLGGDLNDVPGSAPIEALEGSGDLLRVASELASQSTYVWRGQGQALDHLFVDTRAAGAYVAGSAAIFRDGPGEGLGGSDHAAIRAVFRPGDRP